MQATRDNARYAREVKHAHFLWPVLGNQPGMYAALNALDWENTSVAAATSEITRGRVETRTIRVLPVPTAWTSRTRSRPSSSSGTSRSGRTAAG